MDLAGSTSARAAEAYLLDRDRTAAARVLRRIEEAAARLERAPHLGRPARERNVRELVVTRTRYILIDRLLEAEITIIALYHQRQQRPAAVTSDHL